MRDLCVQIPARWVNGWEAYQFHQTKTSQLIAERLHLLWTGMDLRLQPDGQYVLFEANPSPMFLGFEERSGLPLSGALLEILLA
jgi:hypothetical protein